MFNRLCIIGLGLIGGSIARAARARKLCETITAYGRHEDADNLSRAENMGIIDAYFLDGIHAAVDGADCVVIAAPVGASQEIFSLLKPVWNRQVVYTDVGSTKTSVIDAARAVFGHLPDNFVPAHPIAGAERSGVEAALPDLYVNKRLIITPASTTDPELVVKISQFWQGLGAKVETMTADHHDAVFAATSHLPHLVAFALVDMLGHNDEKSEIFKYAASGFKDFTRIASSDPTMWRDICLANKDAIIPLLDQLKDELDKLQRLVAAEDQQQIFDTFTYAREARQRFLNLYET